jgi:hypothetical protein
MSLPTLDSVSAAVECSPALLLMLEQAGRRSTIALRRRCSWVWCSNGDFVNVRKMPSNERLNLVQREVGHERPPIPLRLVAYHQVKTARVEASKA